MVEAGETCDDGNYASGDGCSADCQIEKCFGVVCAGWTRATRVAAILRPACALLPRPPTDQPCDDETHARRPTPVRRESAQGAIRSGVRRATNATMSASATAPPEDAATRPRFDGAACNDGNACTQTDTCQAGICLGSNPVVCAGDQCHDAGTCDQATGTCTNPVKVDGTPCSGGESGAANGVCQDGACHEANCSSIFMVRAVMLTPAH